jgi:hypothetical protein
VNSSEPDSPLLRLVTLPDGVPDLTLGWHVAQWATKYIRHPNGPRAGQRWEFVPSQLRFVLWWYALDDSGQWLFRRAVRRLAKGSGKSPFAALMGLAEFVGPVRPLQRDPDAPGGWTAQRVPMPLVQIAATSEDQTANTMRMVRAMAPKGSRIVKDFGLDPGKTIYYEPGGGELKILTSSAATAEGSEATFVIGDETEHWTPSNGGVEFANTLEDNLVKSGSRMLSTCNAWVPGRDSVAEADFASWVNQEEGRSRTEARILYDARVAPPNTVLHDDPEDGQVGLTEALEFVYGDCFWQTRNLAAIRDKIWDTKTPVDDSRRKYLNQPTAATDAWTTPQAWAALADPSRVVADQEPVVLFFDGSKSRDATALIGCCMSDGHVFTVGVWEPDPSHDAGDIVDAEAVDSEVARAFATWDVVAFFADVREWESFVKVSWPNTYRDKLLVMASPTSREPAWIAWDMRSHVYDFGEACETCEAEIAEKAFTHDGDSRVARHVGNARRRPRSGRVGIGKESPDSPNKIDAAVCVVGARMVRRIVLNSREWKKRRRVGKGRVIALD